MEVNPLYLFYFRKLGPLKPVLIQESLAEDPWKLLIAVTLLNKTTGKVAIPVFWSILDRWPTPFLLSRADEADLTDALRRVGTQSVRAKRLIQLSFNYMLDPPRDYDLRPTRHKIFYTRKRYPATQISHLPGVGAYALDSYRIFCCSLSASTAEEWKYVVPTDKQLIRYLKWKWAYEERKEWTPEQGASGPLTIPCLKSLVDELRAFKPKDSS